MDNVGNDWVFALNVEGCAKIHIVVILVGGIISGFLDFADGSVRIVWDHGTKVQRIKLFF